MKVLARLEKRREVWYVLSILFVFFLLRLPSLIEPYWYGDEGIYQVIGKGLQQGRMLYSEAWDNKPPMLYLVYALFGPEQFAIRFSSLFFGFVSITTFYLLSHALLKHTRAVILSTIIFTLFLATPIIEGNIANAENFMVLPIILGGLLVWRYNDQQLKNRMVLLQAGLLLGIAFLFKIVGFFDFAAFLTFIFFTSFRHTTHIQSLRKRLKPTLAFGIGFALPYLLTVLFFFITGNLSYYLQATFFSNINYVGYKNAFIIPQGFLILKLLLLTVGLIGIYKFRNKLTPSVLFVLVWVLFSLFNAFFSQRPYTHYVLVTLPALSLLTGTIMTTTDRLRISMLALLIFSLVLIHQNFSIHSLQKTSAYYVNFMQFVTDNKSLQDYQAFFDGNTPRDYEVASYLRARMNEDDRMFLWGNSPQIYMLTNTLPPGRFTVAYHIVTNPETIAETTRDLERVKPKYIVILPDLKYYPFSLTSYTPIVMIRDTYIYERIY
jgi:4-amino-4-deoxy-L-arabinose transferase-like glycosyltransferase